MDNRQYEMGVVIQVELSDEAIAKLLDTIKQHVETQGGTVESVNTWGRRPLAYQINKNRDGYYAFLNILTPSAAVSELERILRLNEDILRFLIVRVGE